jgi:hypothetical protein
MFVGATNCKVHIYEIAEKSVQQLCRINTTNES